MKDEVRDGTKAVIKIARIGGRVIVVHGELLSSLGFLKEGAIRGHFSICDSSREAGTQL